MRGPCILEVCPTAHPKKHLYLVKGDQHLTCPAMASAIAAVFEQLEHLSAPSPRDLRQEIIIK